MHTPVTDQLFGERGISYFENHPTLFRHPHEFSTTSTPTSSASKTAIDTIKTLT
ncbi:hypothetical protein PROFUN_04835 [Planoprotostelium fungivorum]|uniref:Uncharacterized protein n=1 Tax=Planoprotostelium fungivorum TaxID=1890364 RepID=A0A2P6NT05_9EUKA|nr:hypothetical protein PROFUN_04835 [Planoprotostelium fungivorum]